MSTTAHRSPRMTDELETAHDLARSFFVIEGAALRENRFTQQGHPARELIPAADDRARHGGGGRTLRAARPLRCSTAASTSPATRRRSSPTGGTPCSWSPQPRSTRPRAPASPCSKRQRPTPGRRAASATGCCARAVGRASPPLSRSSMSRLCQRPVCLDPVCQGSGFHTAYAGTCAPGAAAHRCRRPGADTGSG
jgi:hypothetical protein